MPIINIRIEPVAALQGLSAALNHTLAYKESDVIFLTDTNYLVERDKTHRRRRQPQDLSRFEFNRILYKDYKM